jgi:hypothetical protein
MPAKTTGIRLGNYFGKDEVENKINYHLMPEVMLGINNKLMFHLQGFISNATSGFGLEGGSIYAKYRFYSADEVHQHFRLAGFARGSYNSAVLHQDEIETMAHNSGVELGFIATQLLHKIALSATTSYEQAHFNNVHHYPVTQSNKAFNYSLSFGKLILPKEYNDYKQVNVNLMLELLGQKIVENNLTYLDIAPSIQFIINSQARIDIGYKKELYSNMYRSSPDMLILKLEYTFFSHY